MQLAHYLGLLRAAQERLADAFREVGTGHRDEVDVFHTCRRLAEQCDAHAERIGPFSARYGEAADDEPDRLHSAISRGRGRAASACCATCRTSTSWPPSATSPGLWSVRPPRACVTPSSWTWSRHASRRPRCSSSGPAAGSRRLRRRRWSWHQRRRPRHATPVASPLPLGFLALAAGTLLVTGLQLGWLAADQGSDVALILLAFVFPLQLIASVFGFLARDVVAGTGMGLLSGTWLSIALVTLTAPVPGATSDALGLFLLLAGTAMLVPFVAATTGKLVPAAVLGTTAIRFGVTGLHPLTGSSGWKHAAGAVGLILLAIALHAALALALEDARGATALPVGRHAPGEDAPTGGLEAQVEGIEHAAGVRRQL